MFRYTALNIVAAALMNYANNGIVEDPQGNHRPGAAPHGVYATRTRRQWVAIDVRSDEEWARLREALGRPAWADDARFDTREGRLEHRDQLDRLLEESTSGLDRDDLCDRLGRHRIRAAAVANSREVVMDPQLNARRHWVYLDHPEVGYTVYDDTPIRMSETPPRFASPAPLLGEHTEAVLKSVLGMSDDEYWRLAESGLFQ
jgi:crotonobetainyl-CoA:carnitine CoA-transferase CaiB-like acyl-CoA transferase